MKLEPWGPRYAPFDNFHEVVEDIAECLRQSLVVLELAMESYSPRDILRWTFETRDCCRRLTRRLTQVEKMVQFAEAAMLDGTATSGTPPSEFNFVYHVGPEYYRGDDETVYSGKVKRGNIDD